MAVVGGTTEADAENIMTTEEKNNELDHFTYFQKHKRQYYQQHEIKHDEENIGKRKQEEIDKNEDHKRSNHARRHNKRKQKLSNIVINQDYSLGLPPHYKGSKMFLPTGERIFWQAEVLSTSQDSSTCQDFNEIRCQCLSEGILFEDPEFPAVESSLFPKVLEIRLQKPIKWLRPRDLVKNPQLYVKGYSRFDIRQGRLDDCWLDAALTSLTMHNELFNQVVPDDQGFGEDYAGVFHFRFWQYGRWVDVVIDDRLPTSAGQLIFLHSSEKHEFWSALLEKAYAKLYGSYGAIKGGTPSEAMEVFTGGLAERYRISNLSIDFFSILLKAYMKNSLINASTDPSMRMRCGLRENHAYSITGVKCFDSNPLVRLRNPWGRAEWKGPWSDRSSEWTRTAQEKRDSLRLTVSNDGEFWMSFQDFTEYFSVLYICNLNPECLYPEDCPDDCDKKWVMSMFEGEWVPGETSGGSSEDSEIYCYNPQYIITLTEPDEAAADCVLILSLTQKHTRHQHGQTYLDIGFRVYEVLDEDDDYFVTKAIKISQPQYAKVKVFSARLELEPGRYLIVPYTSLATEKGEFLLRVLTEKPATITTT